MADNTHCGGTRIALVVAVADNGVIGRGGGLPWHLPDDLKHFKAVTWGKPILMGRRTFESIGRALPGRRNLVLSRTSVVDEEKAALGVEYVASLQEACERVRGVPELAVIGGAQLYELALPFASVIFLTRVHASVEGDVRFSLQGTRAGAKGATGWQEWREVERSEHPADERHAYAMSFIRLERSVPHPSTDL
jgi:dihydrofolate reductase